MRDRLARADEAARAQATQDLTYRVQPSSSRTEPPPVAAPEKPAVQVAPSQGRTIAPGRRQGVYFLAEDDARIDAIAQRLREAGVVSARGGGMASLVIRLGLRSLEDALAKDPTEVLAVARRVVKGPARGTRS